MEPGQKAYEAVKQEGTLGPFATLHPDNKAYFAKIEAACVPAVPEDVAGLVERLNNELGWGIGPALLCQEAASALQAQAAEIERLRAAVAEAQANSWSNVGQRERAEAAEAKLREAVEVMSTINRRASPDPARTFDDAIRDLEHVTAYARAFLATIEEPEPYCADVAPGASRRG